MQAELLGGAAPRARKRLLGDPGVELVEPYREEAKGMGGLPGVQPASVIEADPLLQSRGEEVLLGARQPDQERDAALGCEPEGWNRWPSLHISMDLGSDGVAGWRALRHKRAAHAMLYPPRGSQRQEQLLQEVASHALVEPRPLDVDHCQIGVRASSRGEPTRRTKRVPQRALRSLAEHRLDLMPVIVYESGIFVGQSFPRLEPLEKEGWACLAKRSHRGSMGRCCIIARLPRRITRAWSTHLWERTFASLDRATTWAPGRSADSASPRLMGCLRPRGRGR